MGMEKMTLGLLKEPTKHSTPIAVLTFLIDLGN
jgi:hypothetical protein